MSAWTICWTTEDGTDRWDRFEGRSAAEDRIRILEAEGVSVENMLVFPPDSEVAV